MRLPLFVLRHLNQVPHPRTRSEDIWNSKKNVSAAHNCCCDGKNLSGIQFYS
jgi:hypothetical protein